MSGAVFIIRTINGNPSFMIDHEDHKSREPQLAKELCPRISITQGQAAMGIEGLKRMWAAGDFNWAMGKMP